MKKFILIILSVLTVNFISSQTVYQLKSNHFNNIKNFSGNSAPTFIDLDGDGLLDLIAGRGDGKLDYYEQSSPNSEEFILVTENFNNINVTGESKPIFTDLDGDGLLDLIIGEVNPNLSHYEQISPCSEEFILITENFSDIFIMNNSAPVFTDLNGDRLLDLIIGKRNGKLEHYEQNAENPAEFTLVTENFNNIYEQFKSSPTFTDLDNDGLLDLITGEYNGSLSHYEQSSPNSEEFILVNENFSNIHVGHESSPTFTDLDGDGLLDLIVGEKDGNFNHFEQNEENSAEFNLVNENFDNLYKGNNFAPTFTDLDSDGLFDLIIGKKNGKLEHYEQNGENSTEFNFVTDNFGDIDVGYYSYPAFTDLDNDGLSDLITGEYNGSLSHYEQISPNSEEFILVNENFSNIHVGHESSPNFTDLDGDGLLDLIVGDEYGKLNHYEQNTENSTEFTQVTNNFNNIDLEWTSAPAFTDLDNDGLLDLIIGKNAGNLHHYEQNEENSAEFDSVTENFNDIHNLVSPKPTFIDLDGNGLLDLIIGDRYGNLRHYEAVNFTDIEEYDLNQAPVPFTSYLRNSYPNPFLISDKRNCAVSIEFGVKENEEADIAVYNMKGQLVKEFKGYKPGNHTVRWNLKDKHGKKVKAGIYFYSLRTNKTNTTHKMLIIK
ncbi:MAG: hypothetical protein CSB55_07195 [Candidatus Cloacimonadota bacterium]|nr:MAG: hypothetical protein CSB55_07195 [Candidatus Cloacimonadota bacterium]